MVMDTLSNLICRQTKRTNNLVSFLREARQKRGPAGPLPSEVYPCLTRGLVDQDQAVVAAPVGVAVPAIWGLPRCEGQARVALLRPREAPPALRAPKTINRDAFHSRLRPHHAPAHRAGDGLAQPLAGEVDMIILAAVHDGANHQFLPGSGDDVRVFPGKPFDEVYIMLIHGQYLPLEVLVWVTHGFRFQVALPDSCRR